MYLNIPQSLIEKIIRKNIKINQKKQKLHIKFNLNDIIIVYGLSKLKGKYKKIKKNTNPVEKKKMSMKICY